MSGERKRGWRLALPMALLLLFAGCGSEFETVAGEAYRTDKIEGVVVQDAGRGDLSAEETGAPVPTNTPAPPIKEQYEIPDVSGFYFESGNLVVEGEAEVIAPETNAMPSYSLEVLDFSQETVDAVFAACCGTTPMYTSFTEPYSKGELVGMVQELKRWAEVHPDWQERKSLGKEAEQWQKEIESAPEAVKRESSRGTLKKRIGEVEGETVTSTGVSCGSLPEELGLVFQVQNLPHRESGEAIYNGQYARMLFYRDKRVLKSFGETLTSSYDHMLSWEETKEEEADRLKKQGEAFWEEIGVEKDFFVSYIVEQGLKNGEKLYLIGFQRRVEGIPLMENFGYSDAEIGEHNMFIWSHESMRLGIDAEGVCFFCWDSPMETEEEIRLGEMLPFPVIRQTMITLLKERYKSGTRLRVSRMELCYRSRYTEENGAVLLPVWNLYGATVEKNGTVGVERLLLSVNALTGEKMPGRSGRGKGW